MKVCILSMQRVGNMGSLLQSYALKTTIERLGHQVEFIDIEKEKMTINCWVIISRSMIKKKKRQA